MLDKMTEQEPLWMRVLAPILLVMIRIKSLIWRRQLLLDIDDAKKLKFLLQTTERSLLPYERFNVERQLEATKQKIVRIIVFRTIVILMLAGILILWLG